MKRTELKRKTPLSRSSSMKGQTRKRMNAVSKKRSKSRVGKLGIVRLAGKDLENLRLDCFWRDGWKCVVCGIPITWDGTWRIGTPERTYEVVTGPRGEMAHIKAKRNGGDTLENVRTLCPDCHSKEHQYGKSMQKPCPPKERRA